MTTEKLIKFPVFKENNGVLGLYESGEHISPIARVFTVKAMANDIRGQHAHKKCMQLLICVNGEISIDCDNGSKVSTYLLNEMSMGLLIPPGIWSSQCYLADNSVLMVLCDRRYEMDDYIRDYSEFKKFQLNSLTD